MLTNFFAHPFDLISARFPVVKIAVIGSGISGLGASLILSQKHEVTLFESANRLGGHAHTSQIQVDNKKIPVDTGFLVYNELTYPHLTRMFQYLGVETVDSDMSLSISCHAEALEWSGDNLSTVFAQKKNWLNLKFYKMLIQILRFHKNAEDYKIKSAQNRWTVEDLLAQENYGEEIKNWYILPMIAAIWSTPESQMLKFPAETFLTFFLNHKLLQVNDRPQWKTVKDGSINYVDQIAKRIHNLRLNEPVLSVESFDQFVKVRTNHSEFQFDKVVFATHAPVTLKMIQKPSPLVADVLSRFAVTANHASLHRDQRWMPKNKKCWASWNAISSPLKSVSLTYYLNRLQPLKTDKALFLTLNCPQTSESEIMSADYEHPRFDQRAIDAQKLIEGLQGQNHFYFAGAWTRYGFHEDGLLSAVKVAKHLGLEPQWL